ncbi:MAG: methyltransferase domain-containing protein [Pseudomonadota bacterium]
MQYQLYIPHDAIQRGVDMTEAMLDKARASAASVNAQNVSFRQGIIEDLPIDDAWADHVLSNGVLNLCVDKQVVFDEIYRVLKPGGILQFADIANGTPVPEAATNNIALWTA